MHKTVNFIFRAKIIFQFKFVSRSKINTGWYMSEQNWLSSLDTLSLHFKSSVWFNWINYPHSISISSGGWHESNLVSRKRRTNSWGMFHAAKSQAFSIQIFICLNSYFLTISQIAITAENVRIINSSQSENWSCHWTWVLANTGGCNLVALFYIWDSISKIDAHPPLGVCTLNHDTIAPSKISISCVWPWYLLIWLLVGSYRLRKWVLAAAFLGIVVRLLELVESEVFVPVSNLGFEVVFWTTL